VTALIEAGAALVLLGDGGCTATVAAARAGHAGIVTALDGGAHGALRVGA